MRDYLSPARTYLVKALSYVVVLPKAHLMKPRSLTMIASTAAVAFFAASVVTLRTMAGSGVSVDNSVVSEKSTVVPGETSEIKVGEQPNVDSDAAVSDQQPSMEASIVNDSTTSTSIIVNNQPVEVPENGSVHKTITNNNGTTQVDISVNSSNNGSSFSSSSSSIQMNTNTFSNNTNFRSP